MKQKSMSLGVDVSPVSTREMVVRAICYADFVCVLSGPVCGIALNQIMYANRIIIYELQILRLEIIIGRENKGKKEKEKQVRQIECMLVRAVPTPAFKLTCMLTLTLK